MKNINLGATFLFLSILCSIKIERLLFLKFLKNLAFFDSYFWPFNKTHEKNHCHFCDQCNHGFNLKCFYLIPLTWWKTYSGNAISCLSYFESNIYGTCVCAEDWLHLVLVKLRILLNNLQKDGYQYQDRQILWEYEAPSQPQFFGRLVNPFSHWLVLNSVRPKPRPSFGIGAKFFCWKPKLFFFKFFQNVSCFSAS